MSRVDKITPSLEDYIETMMLMEENQPLRITDIAEKMNVAKSSVHAAMEHLQERGLIVHEKYGVPALTEEGRRLGREVYERHTSLKTFFEKILELDPETAGREACAVEHIISDDTIRKIAAFTRKYIGLK